MVANNNLESGSPKRDFWTNPKEKLKLLISLYLATLIFFIPLAQFALAGFLFFPLVLQRKIGLLRKIDSYYETLRLRRFDRCCLSCARVRLRCERYAAWFRRWRYRTMANGSGRSMRSSSMARAIS